MVSFCNGGLCTKIGVSVGMGFSIGMGLLRRVGIRIGWDFLCGERLLTRVGTLWGEAVVGSNVATNSLVPSSLRNNCLSVIAGDSSGPAVATGGVAL